MFKVLKEFSTSTRRCKTNMEVTAEDVAPFHPQGLIDAGLIADEAAPKSQPKANRMKAESGE